MLRIYHNSENSNSLINYKMIRTDANSTTSLSRSTEVSNRNRHHNQKLISELQIDDLIYLETDLEYQEKVSVDLLGWRWHYPILFYYLGFVAIHTVRGYTDWCKVCLAKVTCW